VIAAGKEPGRQRVGVPHVAGTQLVAAPCQRRHPRHEFQQSPRTGDVLADLAGTGDGFRDVWNDAVAPESDLIAKECGATEPARPNWTLPHHAPVGCFVSPHGGHFDDVTLVADADLERGVVEVANAPMLMTGDECLEEAAVPAN
jgi:hypothetical protein